MNTQTFGFNRMYGGGIFPRWVSAILFFIAATTILPAQNITQVEYFFDTDPGNGLGINVPVSPAGNLPALSFNPDMSSVSPGFHKLYLRAKDESLKWSLTAVRPFYKDTITSTLTNITRVEYFLDTDPGQGLATSVPFTPSTSLSGLVFPLNMAAVTPGFHNLFIRAMDANLKWSLLAVRPFYKESTLPELQNVIRIEYFIDNDPGAGLAIQVPFTPATNINDLAFAPDLTSINAGFHQLHIRAKDAGNKWSILAVKPFYKESEATVLQNIVKVEYFIDSDPGYGQAASVPVIPGTNLPGIVFPLNMAVVSPGFHQLHIRAKDAGDKWSLLAVKPFYRESEATLLQDIVKVEYFIDNDPGYGQATQVPVSPGTNLSNLVFPLNMAPISPGFHQLYIRAKNAGNEWGLMAVRPFFKEQEPEELSNIARMEYFIDSDPGNGLATPIPFTPGTNLPNLVFPLNMTSLTPGFHKLYIRSQDASMTWGLTAVRPFYREAANISLPNIARLEYFFDTDPGAGMGIPVPVNPGTNLSNLVFPVDGTCVSNGLHRLYVRAVDVNGKWCFTSSDTVSILKTPPQLTITGSTIFCEGDSVRLSTSAGSNLTYQWHRNNIPIPNAVGSDYYPGSSGLYFATITHHGACSDTTNSVNITVKPAPLPAISGPETLCSDQLEATYTTESGMTGYSWTITGGVITAGGGSADPYITVRWNEFGEHRVLVNYTGTNGCQSVSPAQLTVSVYQVPEPVIYGPDTLCLFTDGAVYSTEPGMSNYTWQVSQGGSVTGSSSGNSIQVSWHETGPQWVSATYTNSHGCTAAMATVYNVVIHPVPEPTLTGTDTLCSSATEWTYFTETGKTNYSWTVSPGNSITAGGTSTSSSIAVKWNSPGTHWIEVNYENEFGCWSPSPVLLYVLVKPIPVPGVSGPSTVCSGVENAIYSTETGMTGYQWSISPGGTIMSGGTQNDHQISVKWTTPGTRWVSINYMQNGCQAAAPAIMNVLVNPVPTPVIAGNASQLGCQSTISTYSTTAGMSNYTWNVSPGGTIISGGTGTNNNVGILWNGLGPQWLSVNFSNATGCPAPQPTVSTLTVIARPHPAISGANVAGQGMGPYQYSTEPGMFNYSWSVSPGGTISGSSTESTVNVIWNSQGNQHVKVNYFNAAYCNAVTPTQFIVSVIPTNTTIQNMNILNGQNMCYNAIQTLTIAGNGTSFNVNPGGSATLIASQKIRFLPQIMVSAGGYLHGYITMNGQYCALTPNPLVTNPKITETGNEKPEEDSGSRHFVLYPNPAEVEFTVKPVGDYSASVSVIEIFNLNGARVLTSNTGMDGIRVISVRSIPAGLYLVHISNPGLHEVIKLVKL